MKNLIFILSITFLSFNCYSQISFEKGYIINSEEQRIDCLIKNVDWKDNPTEFQYKLSENDEPKTATVQSVKAFEISGASKYFKATVSIDRSSEVAKKISHVKNPIFNEEQLFLKVLIQGKASLYSYEDGLLKRFFYKTDSSKIKQLIFKSYLVSYNDNTIKENNAYKQQLWNSLQCQNISKKSIESIDYKRGELVKFFVKYNECSNSKLIIYDKKKKRDLFNLTIKVGLSNSSLDISNRFTDPKRVSFSNELNLRFGIEAEVIMPFNKNKWSVLVEPSYQYYKSETKAIQTIHLQRELDVTVDYKSIEIPVGVRYYFFLNEHSKIFIDAMYVLDFSMDSKITYEYTSDLDIKTLANLAFGMGYKYGNASLELRYGLGRDILADYVSWGSNYKSLSIIFGYTLF